MRGRLLVGVLYLLKNKQEALEQQNCLNLFNMSHSQVKEIVSREKYNQLFKKDI